MNSQGHGAPSGSVRMLRAAADLRRRLVGSDAREVARYLRSADEPRLHVGGGPRCLDGWLNSDLNRASGVVAMDATRPFPLPDALFAIVFSEHMIEHVSHAQGLAMLRECHRVLRPGGAIRIVTPDLATLLAMAKPQLSGAEQQYFDYCCQHFIGPGEPRTVASVMNALFRGWGHTFIYDEPTLRSALAAAGFVDITRCRLGESAHRQLQGLEHESRYPPGLLDFESLALEAIKPPRGNEPG